MYAELAAVDPEYAAKIHPTDPIRIVRALEVFALSGEPLSEHHRRHAAEPVRYDARFVALEVARPALALRINARAKAMLAEGWVEEVRAILADGYAWDLKPLRSVGYAEVVDHVRGELPGRVWRRPSPRPPGPSRSVSGRGSAESRGSPGCRRRRPRGRNFLRATEEFLAGEIKCAARAR